MGLRPVSGLFGQRGAVAYDSSIAYDGLAVNIPALDKLEKVGEVAGAVEDVATGLARVYPRTLLTLLGKLPTLLRSWNPLWIRYLDLTTES